MGCKYSKFGGACCCNSQYNGSVLEAPDNDEKGEAYDLPKFQEYSFEKLRSATSGFSVDNIVSEHGEKAPNVVYKRKLENHRRVAVKRFNRMAWPDSRQFMEVDHNVENCSFLSKHANVMSMNYYGMRCPMVEMLARNTVNRALQSDPSLAAGLLRMHFHDFFVEGCDGSVFLDSTKDNTAEKDSPANLSPRGYEVIDAAKDLIEDQCPGIVSCADIVAMVARDAVFWAGGPLYVIPKGRKYGRRSKIDDTRNLPAPFLNSSELISIFSKHGFSVQDMVSLSCNLNTQIIFQAYLDYVSCDALYCPQTFCENGLNVARELD